MIHIAGDSTAAAFAAEDPRVGWGAALEAELVGAAVNNLARSGRSSRSYVNEGHWDELKSKLGPGDLVLIEFGHNDQKDDPLRSTEAGTTFREYLRRYVGESRALGAVPVLLTPICRRRFEAGGLVPTHGAYPEATRAVAAETKTPLVDMTELTRELLERFGAEGSLALFAPGDNTHLSAAGAAEVARLVARGLGDLGLPVARRVPLWPEGPLGAPLGGSAPVEYEREGRLFGVRDPALAFHPASAATRNGTAVVVCPGGGYTRLCMVKEGKEVAAWLNGLGIAAFVLSYRLSEYGYPAPLQDVLRAIRVVRSRAREFGVVPERVGVLGFSAGGHVAASAATLFDDPDGKTGAPLDAVDARPSFAVLLYPVITLLEPYGHEGSRSALLGARSDPALTAKLSLESRVGPKTPPTFLMHTREDGSVPVENSLLFRDALERARVPNELHVYEHGPHGIGLRPGFGDASRWPEACAAWLRARGLLAE